MSSNKSLTVSSELKNTSLKNVHYRCQLGNKNCKYRFKQNILNFLSFWRYNFSKVEMFEDETLTRKNPAKFKDFIMPKCTSSGFFLSITFCIKRILTTTEYCNLK